MQPTPGTAIISSAALMSNTADEVDWEWSGNNYGQQKPNVQTNYFGKGVTGSYDRSTSVFTEFEMTTGLHKYSIDWTAESLTWSIDDKVVRTLMREDCDDPEHQYPQTPSRLHLGVWAAGDPNEPEGVRHWAGGETDFNKLPFVAYVRNVTLEPSSKCAYFNYTDKSGSSDSVKCLVELPQSASSVVGPAALDTLSAAQPAPTTPSRVSNSSAASSSSPSGATGGKTLTNITGSQNTQATRVTGSSELTISTVYKTTVFETVTSCDTAVTDYPANKPLTSTVSVMDVVVDYTTVCPVTQDKGQSSTQQGSPTDVTSTPVSSTAEMPTVPKLAASQSKWSSSGSSSTSSTVYSTGSFSSEGESALTMHNSSSGNAPSSSTSMVEPGSGPAPQQSVAPASLPPDSTASHSTIAETLGGRSNEAVTSSGESATGPTTSPELTTSTVYSTDIHTVTSCGPEVKRCPAESTVLSTEVVAAYTTVCPVSGDSPPPPNGSPGLSAGNPSGPRLSDSVPPLSPSSSAFITPQDEVQTQSSLMLLPGSSSASGADCSTLPPSSTTSSSEDGVHEQPPTASPTDAYGVPPSNPVAESQAATMPIEFGQTSVSLYNIHSEMEASGSSTAPTRLPTGQGGNASREAQSNAIPGTVSSRGAQEHGSAPPPPEAGGSRSSTGVVAPVPVSSDGGLETTRSTTTRTTTTRLAGMRQSTATVYSTSATVLTNCAPGESSRDCSTISSTTVATSELVTPVTFTSTAVSAAAETVGVVSSSAAGQGASGVAPGVAGAGTGTGQQPGQARTTLATIAGAERTFKAVPGLLLLALVIGVFL
jgi:beta-glucanase (GH16 family)